MVIVQKLETPPKKKLVYVNDDEGEMAFYAEEVLKLDYSHPVYPVNKYHTLRNSSKPKTRNWQISNMYLSVVSMDTQYEGKKLLLQ